ncbi:acyl-CoA dehydrogenase [Sphingobium xenophagum]|uniref:Acyl-CoA dehydrogenase n=1 Tax=Sphingobium xenophagum TaxID=121428 RepID=A0A249MSG7_SPHXE|nr:acyl-CoA dehydrogenase family protein [Sphingobium xenophagum]ASY44134.1 acyl-CoA dehydrogenase [Sphingobium xenophagum]
MASAPDISLPPKAAQRWPRRKEPELYHDLMSPDEVLAIRAEVRAFAERVVAPRARAIGDAEEKIEHFPWDVFRAMGDAGLFRIPFPAEVGGRGLSHPAAATAAVIEELSYYSSSVGAIYDVHCILAGHALVQGSAYLQRTYLAALLDGSKVGAFATTEPDASTDLSVAAMVTHATKVEGGYQVSGHKRFITNAPVANFVVLLCRDGERMTELVVDLTQPGVRVGKPDRKIGNNGQLTADIYFDNAFVPDQNLLGERGKGLRVALQTLTYGRIGIAAAGTGLAQSLFDHCVERLENRKAFGKALGQFQHWQFRMAERATGIENARNLYLKAALRKDSGIAFPEPEAGMAKYYATELAGDFAREAVQIFGGYGFLRELSHDGSHAHVGEIYRDVKIAEIYEGANEVQKWIIARQIFGKEITG